MNWGGAGVGVVPACAGMTERGAGMTGVSSDGVSWTPGGGVWGVREWGLAAWVGELEDGGDAAGCLREPAYLLQRQRASQDFVLAVGEPLL